MKKDPPQLCVLDVCGCNPEECKNKIKLPWDNASNYTPRNFPFHKPICKVIFNSPLDAIFGYFPDNLLKEISLPGNAKLKIEEEKISQSKPKKKEPY